ncbi:MAG: hypothetical protein ACYSPI_06290 [Planctomycetota bacterium]|jgi:hypothetical protein
MELLPSFRKSEKQNRLVYKVSGHNRPYVLLIMPFIIAAGIFLIVNNKLPGFQPAILVAEAVVLLIIILLYFKFIHNNVFNGQWLLMLGKEGIHINPYLRRWTVLKRQIIYAPFHEIKHIQLSRRTVQSHGVFGGEQRTLHYKFLDITFYDSIANLLLQNMMEEDREAIEDRKDDILKVMECFQSSQVTLRNPKTIRIRMDNLSADILSAIAYFQERRVRIIDDRCEEVSYQIEEYRHMEKILAAVAISDDTSAAIQLAQKLYCLDEGEAKQFIIQLKGSVTN